MAYNNGGYNNNYGARNNVNAPRNSAPRNQNQQKQLSSTGPTLFNESVGKFLNFNYWGRYASIEIGQVPVGSQMTWDVRKNAQKVTQVISFSDLSEIQDICEEVIESIKNTGTFTPAAVRVGMKEDCMVEINNGSTLGLSPGVYVVIYKNLDSGNRTNNLEFYPFSNCKVIRGYDHTSGAGKEDISKIGEFKKFYKMISQATKAFTMAQAHAITLAGEPDKLACFKALAALTASIGIDMNNELRGVRESQQNNYRRNNGSGSTGGSGYSRGGYNAPRSAPRSGTFENSNTGGYDQNLVATLDDPVDINLSMSNLTNVDMSKFT